MLKFYCKNPNKQKKKRFEAKSKNHRLADLQMMALDTSGHHLNPLLFAIIGHNVTRLCDQRL